MKDSTQPLSKEELREWLNCAAGQLIEFTMSHRRAQRAAKDRETLQKIKGRPIHLKDGPRIQFTLQFDKSQRHENVALNQFASRCLEFLPHEFEHLHLFTSESDAAIRSRPDGDFLLKQGPPSKSKPTIADVQAHNRSRQYLIPEDQPCPFLFEIGVMSREGQVLAAKRNKFRQINRFLELVNDVLVDLPADREIQVVDFGSGKSYLTFALHHLLTAIHGRPARIRGVDLKRDVINQCSAIAGKLKCDGLSFHYGDIASFAESNQVDMMVSLHACDTATDAALTQAVRWKTPVILSVPCCQHELAREFSPQPSLETLTRYGILRERFAALSTDALRADLMELCGYHTQIIEFVDLEHTAKNLLIRAVKRQQELTSRQLAEIETRYTQFKQLLGIRDFALERFLGIMPTRTV